MITDEEAGPLSMGLLLTPDLESARDARRRLRPFLERHEVPIDRIADAELLLSELVVNAVAHSISSIDVFTRIERRFLRIWVSDAADEPAGRAGISLPEQAAWDLKLVHSVASSWGVRARVDGKPGRTIWADLALDGQAPAVVRRRRRWWPFGGTTRPLGRKPPAAVRSTGRAPAIAVAPGGGAGVVSGMPDSFPSDTDHATPAAENIATRSELTIEERAVGSDDPRAQARAILSESEERIEIASDDAAREAADVERRTSDETVDPPPSR